MPLPRALHIILEVCDAVGEAHAKGIVHRDLKPENVMLVRRGDDADFVKVLDFGVARIDWADTSVATQAGVIFGTARYISPEGAQGLPVSSPSDVYSIAVMLFQCLSGQTPFDADNPVGILIKHTSEPAPDVRSIARSSYVPEAIARVIAANLAKDPAERCRDARELGRALVDAARASGLSPDDLVVRSTLLGGARSALSLVSMERTKALDLTPELAAKMAGKSTASGTQIVESDAGDGKTRIDAADDVASSRAELDAPRARPQPSEPDRPSRPSGVEPTISDEPSSETS
jgi:serine/threonine-protein kinase